ncbi:MAG: hypothetical protein JWL90_4599 [Chthoniobacteraceae bacterium]|nr:hypothetical protein [Chthoniobacteraceae bacterium]
MVSSMPQPTADAARFSDGINLILYGPSGTGKTHWLHEKSLDIAMRLRLRMRRVGSMNSSHATDGVR